MLAGAHVPDLAGPLAIAGEPRRGQLVERHALDARRESAWTRPSAGTALERPDVEVLAGVAAGHDRDLGRLEVERLDPAGLEQREHAERLDAGPEVDDLIGVAERADHPSVDVDLDDVAPVDALLDPVADLADEHRRHVPARAARRVGTLRSGRGAVARLDDEGRTEDLGGHDRARILRTT